MSSHESHVTVRHDQIRAWIEDRGGRPVAVEATGSGDDPGILRVDFPGVGDEEGFQSLDWDTFFRKFDDSQLAFLYQDQTSDGGTSRFCKFVDRNEHDVTD